MPVKPIFRRIVSKSRAYAIQALLAGPRVHCRIVSWGFLPGDEARFEIHSAMAPLNWETSDAPYADFTRYAVHARCWVRAPLGCAVGRTGSGPCERWISVTALLAACLRPQSALRPLKRGEGAADYPQRNSQRPWISLFGQVFLVQNNDQ